MENAKQVTRQRKTERALKTYMREVTLIEELDYDELEVEFMREDSARYLAAH